MSRSERLTRGEIQFMLWLRKQALFATHIQKLQVRQEWQESEIDTLKRDFRDMLRILMGAADPEFRTYQEALKDSRFVEARREEPSDGIRPD